MEEREIQQKTEEFMGFIRSLTREQQNAVISVVTNEHRTHQQTFMRSFVFPLIAKWAAAYEEKRYDARNEATTRFCKSCLQENEYECFPYI